MTDVRFVFCVRREVNLEWGRWLAVDGKLSAEMDEQARRVSGKPGAISKSCRIWQTCSGLDVNRRGQATRERTGGGGLIMLILHSYLSGYEIWRESWLFSFWNGVSSIAPEPGVFFYVFLF